MDFAKKGVLGDLTSCMEKGASASANCFASAQLPDLPRYLRPEIKFENSKGAGARAAAGAAAEAATEAAVKSTI